MEKKLIKMIFGIVGVGGFGREVMPVARSYIASKYSHIDKDDIEVVFVETEPKVDFVNDIRIMSDKDFISLNVEQKYFNVTIGSSSKRELISRRLIDAGCIPFSIFANSAIIYNAVTIGESATICDNVMILPNVEIGTFFHANFYSYVAHDCKIGNFVTFAPRVSCNGNVVIEDYAYIGTGAILKQGNNNKPLVIGRGATVGMGAVVTKDVPSNTVVGNPAKPIIK